MTKVQLEMSMSLDGYIAGPDVSSARPMGRGGEVLHEWMFDGRLAAESEDFETNHFSSIGALIIGRRMADVGIGPWGEEPTFHAPVFVVTSRPAETIVKLGGTSYIFVTNGIDDALERAREAAGSADVLVNGGATIARQYLEAGAIDELRLHLVPAVLGAGTRLFRRQQGLGGNTRISHRGDRQSLGDSPHLRTLTKQQLSKWSAPTAVRLAGRVRRALLPVRATGRWWPSRWRSGGR